MTQEIKEENGSVQGKNAVIETQQTLSWRRFLIGPVLGVYMLGYLMSFYIITEYTNEVWRDKKLAEANITTNVTSTVGCSVNESSSDIKVLKQGSSMASRYISYYSLAQGVPAVASNLILGSYTDTFGRKFLLAIGISGTAIKVILSFFIVYFKMDLYFFLGACAIEGISGQYVTTFQVSLAYVGDSTKPGDHRTYGVAYVLFCLGVFASLASILAGYVIELYSYYAAFFVAGVILIITFITMLTLLPESLPPEKRLTNKSLSAALYSSFSFFVSKDFGNNRWKYRLLLLAHAFCDFSLLGRIGVETLYQLTEPFCWSVEKVGWFGTVRFAGMSLFSVVLVRVYKTVFSDISLAIIGTMAYAAAFILTGLANSNNMLYAAGVIICFGGLEGTIIRSVVSSMTSSKQQGAIFSAFAAVEVLMNLLSNVGTNAIYSLSVQFMKGFVFFVMAGIDSVAIVLLIIVYFGMKIENKRVKIEQI